MYHQHAKGVQPLEQELADIQRCVCKAALSSCPVDGASSMKILSMCMAACACMHVHACMASSSEPMQYCDGLVPTPYVCPQWRFLGLDRFLGPSADMPSLACCSAKAEAEQRYAHHHKALSEFEGTHQPKEAEIQRLRQELENHARCAPALLGPPHLVARCMTAAHVCCHLIMHLGPACSLCTGSAHAAGAPVAHADGSVSATGLLGCWSLRCWSAHCVRCFMQRQEGG